MEPQQPRGAPEADAGTNAFGAECGGAPRQGPDVLRAVTAEVGRLGEVPPLPGLAPRLMHGGAATTAEPEAEAGPEADSGASHNKPGRARALHAVAVSESAPPARGRSAGSLPVQVPIWGSAPTVEAEDERDDDNSGAQALGQTILPGLLVREAHGADGRLQRFFDDGRCEVLFPSGLRKVLWLEGRTSVFFQNGDVKETHPDGVIVYHYQSTGAVQTTQPDGTDIYRFSSGQTEWHRPNGSKEIEFANGARKRISASGFEEVCLANGVGTWAPVSSEAMESLAADAGA